MLEDYIQIDKVKVDSFKKLIQQLTKQKSVKISTNGTVNIIYRFKPGEHGIDHKETVELEKKLIDTIYAVTKIKYKVEAVQKEPVFCYNTYVRLINISSEHSRDKPKRFLSYFKKNELGSFVKTSYAEIKFKILPISKNDFINFLITE